MTFPNEESSSKSFTSVEELPALDSTKVGEQEAENEQAIAYSGKKRKMVTVKLYSMPSIPLPEQGSWHLNRKKAILAKYPQIKELYGRNPWTFAITLSAVVLQTLAAISVSQAPWYVILLASYIFGAYFNWISIVTGHECAHGLVFSNKTVSRISAMIAFAPTFFGPFGYFWYIEHMYHHQIVIDKMNRFGPQTHSLGNKIFGALFFVAGVNILFTATSITAALILIKNIVLYAVGLRKNVFEQTYPRWLRPYDSFPQVANSPWFFVNMMIQVVYFGLLYYFYGWAPLVYLYLGNSFCNGLHPLGMRNVSEHYIQRKGQPTNCVYSSWSTILLNIGYHNEHHDFPSIPWNRLPQVRAIAREYYDTLFYYNSFTEVMVHFLSNSGIPLSALLDEDFGVFKQS